MPPPLTSPSPLPSETTLPDIYTINLVVTITLFILAVLIGVSTQVIKSYRGVWQAAIATATIAGGFLVITLVGPGSGVDLAPFLSQALFVCGYALIYLAICRFTERPYNKWILLGFVPACLVAMIVVLATGAERWAFRMIALIGGFVLFGAAGLTVWRSEHRRYRLSAWITAATLVLFSASMAAQLVGGFFSLEAVLPIGGVWERTSTLAFFAFSFLWAGGFILMVSQRLQSDLNDLAMNDALTRVRNRRAMDQLLDFEMERVHEEVRDFSIILIDIDHFKRVNDTYGHDVGDRVLQWFASTLQNQMRVQDVVARWGGEEFLILLPDTDLQEAEHIAERLREAVEEAPFEAREGTLNMTFSAGVSSSSTNRDVKDLCKVADKALYVAKQTRNRVVTQEATGEEA